MAGQEGRKEHDEEKRSVRRKGDRRGRSRLSGRIRSSGAAVGVRAGGI